MEETTLSRRLPKEEILHNPNRLHGSVRNKIIEVICFLLMVYFFYEGIFKIIHIIGYGHWLSNKPYLENAKSLLQYGIPIVEISISILVAIPRYRKIALYAIILSQLIFIAWIWNIFPFKSLIFSPYHSYIIRPKWLDKMLFALSVSWVSVIAIYLLLKNTFKTKQ